MRTIISFILILFLLPFPIMATNDISVSAKAAVLYDPVCDAVIWGKQANTVLGMASTTKIMTAVVSMELYDVTSTIEVQDKWCGIEGSSMYLKAGETITVKDLLYGLLLASGNDAATALAGIYTGNQADFVACMNAKAAELRLKDTHFCNPSGLSEEGHYTSAFDLARLTAYAMQQPLFAEIVNTKQYSCGTRILQNHNKLLSQIDACGVKTGYTKADGRCLVSAKEENGRMLIAVTLSAPDDWNDHQRMYKAGFASLSKITPIEAGTIAHIPVINNSMKDVPVYCIDTYTISMTQTLHDQITVHILGPRFVYPNEVKGGQQYGKVQVRCNNKVLFESELYYAHSAHECKKEITLWQRFLNWISCLLE